MKFPRNAKAFRGQLDAAPMAAVFFLLVMFLLLASLMYTPGVKIKLPVAAGLPGVDGLRVTVAVDSSGKFYFQNQVVTETELSSRLTAVARSSSQPLTLIVQADEAVRNDTIIRLSLLAHDAGISEAVLATLPRPFSEAAANPSP